MGASVPPSPQLGAPVPRPLSRVSRPPIYLLNRAPPPHPLRVPRRISQPQMLEAAVVHTAVHM